MAAGESGNNKLKPSRLECLRLNYLLYLIGIDNRTASKSSLLILDCILLLIREDWTVSRKINYRIPMLSYIMPDAKKVTLCQWS